MAKKKVERFTPEVFKAADPIQCHDEAGREAHPAAASLFYPRYDQGELTWMGGRISLVARKGCVLATLSCDQTGRQVTVETDSLLTVLDALEAVLSVPPIPWEDTYDKRKTRVAYLKGDE